MGGKQNQAINPLKNDQQNEDKYHHLFEKLFSNNLVSKFFHDAHRDEKQFRIRPSIIPYRKINKIQQAQLKILISEDNYALIQQKIQKKSDLLFLELFGSDTYFTLIHLVVQSDRPYILEAILKQVHKISIDHYVKYVNLQTYDGYTPLMIGVLNNSIDCIQLLLSAGGIQLNIKDFQGKDVMKYVEKNENPIIKKIFQKSLSVGAFKAINDSIMKSKAPLKIVRKSSSSNSFGKLYINPKKEIPAQLIKKFPNQFSKPVREAYPQIQELIKNKKFYLDFVFPAENRILSHLNFQSNYLDSIVWLRPIQIFPDGDYQLFNKSMSAKDIVQGQLKSCYYLSILASMAEYPERIKKLFKNGLNIYGIYLIQFFLQGRPRIVVIDDQLPCLSTKTQVLFAKSNNKAIWVNLLQKAWIKQFKYYSKAESVPPDLIIQDITSAPSYGYWIKNYQQDQIFQRLLHFYQKKYIIVAVSKKNQVKGIIPGHSYSILNIYHDGGIKLIKMRNPMGNFQWSGQYGDSSKSWTKQMLAKLKQVNKDDGEFWLTPQQFIQLFEYLAVGYYRQNYKYSYEKVKSKAHENLYFQFEIKKDMDVNIRFIQKFNKYLLDEKYKYSPIIFNTIKVKNQKQAQFIDFGCSRSQYGYKNIQFSPQVFLNLKAGLYYMHLKVKWVSSVYIHGVLGTYAEQQIKINVLNPNIGEQFLKSAYFSVLEKQKQGWIQSGDILKKQLKIKSTTIIGIKSNQKGQKSLRVQEMNNCLLDLGMSSENTLLVEHNSVGTLEKQNNSKIIEYKVIIE